MRKKIILIFAAVFLLLVAGLASAMEPVKNKTGNAADKRAANFTLSDLNGQKVSLSDFKDKPVILFFWTTWCPYCRKELKILNSKHQELVKEGLQVLAIDAGESVSKVEAAVKNYNLNFSVLLDKDGSVVDLYNVLGVPTYVFIGKDGSIRFQGHSFPEDEYRDLISE